MSSPYCEQYGRMTGPSWTQWANPIVRYELIMTPLLKKLDRPWRHSPLFSISMTACSSILALGMMPLCLIIYTATWTSTGSIQIPYDSIGKEETLSWLLTHVHCTGLLQWCCEMVVSSGITLVSLLVPTGLGMLVKRKWPHYAKQILKVRNVKYCLLFD